MAGGNDPNRAKRRRAVRAALVLGGVVLLIYFGFILTGVLGAG